MASNTLRLYLSGGTSNTTPLNSLGGAASQQFLGGFSSLKATWQGTPIAGITLGEAVNVPLGVATVLFATVGAQFEVFYSDNSWSAVQFGGDGLYTLQGNFGSYLTVNVVSASLPGSNTNSTILLAKSNNNLFDDVGVSERLAGRVEYRCAYLKNEGLIDTLGVAITLVQPQLGYAEIAPEVITTPTHNGTMTTTVLESKQLRNWRLDPPWLRSTRVGNVWSMDTHENKSVAQSTTDEGVQIVQDSDGITVGISRVIVDEVDSTQKLAAVPFSTIAQWDSIKAGKYVSFWLKRYLPPSAGGILINDSIGLKITQTK